MPQYLMSNRLILFQKGPSNYTTTEYGQCSARCGDGTQTNITMFCKVKDDFTIDCDRMETIGTCNLGDCPRKQYLLYTVYAILLNLAQ